MMQLIKSVLEFIASLFRTQHFTGLIPDERPAQEKQKDYAHEERVVSYAANPFGNQKIEEIPYTFKNQNATSECVPHAVGLALELERKADTGNYSEISPTFAYRLRANYPDEGSAPQNMFDVYRNYGAPLYTTLPTPLSEEEANKVSLTAQMYTEAAVFKGKTYWTVKDKFNDINELASIAAQGHAVPITIFATYEEWARQYPYIINKNLTYTTAEVRHAVTVLPYSGFIEKGIKYVTIQDSSWFGGFRLRYVSEDFIKTRCYGAGYWDTVSVLGTGKPPTFTFSKVLKYGATGEEVKQMQLLLIAEGLLPSDCATGGFYGRTLAAVNAFQTKYSADILQPLNLPKPTGVWGLACISKANSLYA